METADTTSYKRGYEAVLQISWRFSPNQAVIKISLGQKNLLINGVFCGISPSGNPAFTLLHEAILLHAPVSFHFLPFSPHNFKGASRLIYKALSFPCLPQNRLLISRNSFHILMPEGLLAGAISHLSRLDWSWFPCSSTLPWAGFISATSRPSLKTAQLLQDVRKQTTSQQVASALIFDLTPRQHLHCKFSSSY